MLTPYPILDFVHVGKDAWKIGQVIRPEAEQYPSLILEGGRGVTWSWADTSYAIKPQQMGNLVTGRCLHQFSPIR